MFHWGYLAPINGKLKGKLCGRVLLDKPYINAHKKVGYWILSLYSSNVSMALYCLYIVTLLLPTSILDERLQQPTYYANYLSIQIGMNNNFTHQCVQLISSYFHPWKNTHSPRNLCPKLTLVKLRFWFTSGLNLQNLTPNI